MKNSGRKNLGFVLLALIALILACKSSRTDSPSTIDALGFNDETNVAVELVKQANESLKEISKLNKKNQQNITDLKAALSDKDIEKLKSVTDDLVKAINDGLDSGKTAAAKLREAQNKNIGNKFKQYLSLQEDATNKRVEAFEFRRDAARLLRDELDKSTSKEQLKKLDNQFKQNEDNFQKRMDVADDLIKQAKEIVAETSAPKP